VSEGKGMRKFGKLAAVAAGLGWWSWAGRKAFREAGPTVAKGFTFSFEIILEILFELELPSNPNHTHLTPNKIQKKSNSHILP
jgi:hypothetical protein